MDYRFARLSDGDRVAVIDIFNYYVQNSFAAYPSVNLGYDAFDFITRLIGGYPSVSVRDGNDEVIGFGFIRAYNPSDTMTRTAEVSYFLAPGHTRKGIGSAILEHLIAEGRKMEVDNLLAGISSRNEQSINFHLRHGFVECGRFKNVGKKFGEDFDIVWMQKKL